MTLPIRLRITLWYGALLAGALLVFSLTVYLLMADTLVTNLDSSLRQRIDQVETTVDAVNGHLVLPGGGEQADVPFIPAALQTPTGHIVGGSAPAVVRQWVRQHPDALGARFHAQSVGTLRLASAPITDNGRVIGHVLAWQSLKPVEAARHSLFLVLAGAVPALLLIAGLGGLALGRRALAPVATITLAASRISATDLRRRVPVGSPHDEVSELAATFNAMIDRLEAAVQRERRFTADASHELRSPLAVVRAEASLALERPRTSDEYRRVLGVVDQQAGAMEDLVSGLLLLARVESLRTLQTEEAPLDELIETAVVQCRPPQGRADVTVARTVDPMLVVRGSPPLLTRAIRNILDNAIKFSPSGGHVRINGYRRGSNAVVQIQDQGPGLAPEDQRNIFDPFFQVSTARTPGESHGLGLAICQRIIGAHGGTVAVESSRGAGATFTIVLPQTDDHKAPVYG